MKFFVTGKRRLFRALLQPFIVAHTGQARDLRTGHERFHERHQNRTDGPRHGIDFRPTWPARLLQCRGILVSCSGQCCVNERMWTTRQLAYLHIIFEICAFLMESDHWCAWNPRNRWGIPVNLFTLSSHHLLSSKEGFHFDRWMFCLPVSRPIFDTITSYSQNFWN